MLYVATGLAFQFLRFAHTEYLGLLYGSQNKQRLFPYTALTESLITKEKKSVYCAVGNKYITVI